MKNRKVFVVQNQHRWDRETSSFVPKFDLRPAEEYGELVFLLSPTAAPFRSAPIVEELKEKLRDFGPNDYLLLVGNPVLIGLSMTIATMYNHGAVSVLQWSGKDQRYVSIFAENLFTSSDF